MAEDSGGKDNAAMAEGSGGEDEAAVAMAEGSSNLMAEGRAAAMLSSQSAV